ncbi:uncharacterized protein LOC135145272 isoform X2 [Zophobas morio]|uniref:uncharacterized protein LOC135145272 isoform X2 n=1 Tax=Zophobas morio TaxID=2755281 RepID=UPI003082EE33
MTLSDKRVKTVAALAPLILHVWMGFPCPSFKKATAICVRSARSKRAPLKTKNLLLIIERCYELLLSVEEFGVLCRYYKNLFADLFSRANRYMSPFWNFPSWNSTWSQ